ncbi:hypothetical protein [uncultured Flavobacterium sp.]|uniref:hypothetical protein n=1 Tax=uncultured Flavobacterium sp. TaxID=165435 RepID=UPI0030C7E6A3
MPSSSNTPPVVRRYYPTLSSVVSLDDFPESLSFVKQGLQSLFSNIHYKDLQYKKSPKGDKAFYSLSIVTNKLGIELFGSGVRLVINPDESETTDSSISAFPVTLEYEWRILAYLRSFDLNNFSFTPQEFFELGLVILNVSEEQAIAQFINTFTIPVDEDTLALEQFITDLKDYNNDPVIQTLNLTVNEDTKLTEVVQAINSHTDKYATLYAFGAYLLNNDLNETKRKLEVFFKSFIPEDIESYIKDILIPKARVTLNVSTAVEFPRNILYPYKLNDTTGIWEREPENSTVLTRFYFGNVLLYADTQEGVGYKMDLVGDLRPTYSEIGKTGLLIQLERLKIDLSDKVNIPEADADGRSVDFRGVYADTLSVTLPAKWFKTATNTNGSTLRIGGYGLLIGTGGVSGTFALEAVPTENPSDGQIIDFFSSKFNFVYPIVGLKNNIITKEEESILINDEAELLTYLNSLNNKNLYNFKFPLNINPTSGLSKEFNSLAEFRSYITDIVVSENGTMWFNIGSETKGFLVGFQKFDITFKQNKVISSNIKGALEIKKFVYPGTTDPVHIDIEGHLSDDGDFNLTASAQPPYPIEFPDVFTYHMKSVELGKEDNDFYIGTSGTLQFEGFLKETLQLGPIEIERLRIYSDGSIEFKGGSVQLINPIVLPLGPVEITVSAIHYGSHQKEVNGVMRKFNYFGFDGGVSIDPLGIEVRGDGVKYYYCVDDVEGQEKPKPYLHIQTLYLDLVIPANSGSLAKINGWVTIPEPGVSKEYAGGITLQIPKAKLAGKAEMKLMPRYPAFIIDCELEPPVPIPLGTFAIYGFRGLLGYRYVAEKQAIQGFTSDNTWYEYYKAPRRGINVQKFNGPDKSVNYNTLVSLGAGATLGTSADDGYTFSIKAMALFSIPSLFMIDGRANILAARLGLDDTKDPPFFAFVAVGDDSLEFGFGADYKLPGNGKILTIYADVQAGFFFKNQKPWYINIGTNVNPITARILTLLTIKSYVMLSAKGIEAGARGEFNFDRNYGVIKVQAHAFIEVGGKVSFERPQMGAYLMAGVSARVRVLFVTLSLDIGILFGVEAPKPFLIYGKFYFRVKVGIKIFGKRITLFKFSGNLEVVWNFNKNIDRTPINPLINESNADAIPELVQGISMLTNEPFLLGYLASPPTGAPNELILEHIIPLDTYIDIKTQKGLLPGNTQDPNNSVRKLIGGINNAPANYVDLIPPVSTMKGRSIRQVKHQYTIDHLEIKFWNETKNIWEHYHPYEALYPNEPSIANLKVGQFQKTDGIYNAVRLLATTPFSYTEQGEPGWYVPEQYGINASTLFCEAEQREKKCATFLQKPLHGKYYCGDANTPLFSNGVSFQLITPNADEDYAYVTDEANFFNITKSLAFNNWNGLEILLPQPSIMTALKLSNFSNGVKVKFYAVIQSPQNDVLFNVVYGNPNPAAANVNEPFEMVLFGDDLHDEIHYNFSTNSSGVWQPIHDDWRPVSRIVVEPIFDSSISQQINLLNDEIATIENDNNLISLGIIDGDILSTAALEEELHQLICGVSGVGSSDSFVNRYSKKDLLNYYYSKEFTEKDTQFIYAIGTTEQRGLLSKITKDGSLVWEAKYVLPANTKEKLIFKRIIQIEKQGSNEFQYVVYATTGKQHYLLSFNPEDGKIIWCKHIEWGDEDIFVHIAPSKKEFQFYLTLTDRNQIDTRREPFVAVIDSSGEFIKGSLLVIEKEEFIVSVICEDVDGFVVAGRYIEGEYNDSVGSIMKISHDLELITSIKIDKRYSTIHDIKITANGAYLLSGYDSKQEGLFALLVDGEGSYTSYQFPNTKHHNSSVQLGNDAFYFLQNNDYNGVLHKVSYDFNVIWSKEIHLNSGTNGIRNFTFNSTSKAITLNCFNQNEGSLVVHANSNLQSCLTNELNASNLTPLAVEIVKFEGKLEGYELGLKELGCESENFGSEIKPYCEAEGCGEADPKVCELYEQISTIYSNCLLNPSIISEANFEAVSLCYRDILGLIESFDPNYNLGGYLTNELQLINQFLNKKDIQNYTQAWNAVQSVLDYLNEIGNCICECTPKDFTMIHQVCWMSVEDYEYNVNIPSQEAITEDAQAAIDGITKYIQPIWRPDTSYYIHFILKDNVDNGSTVQSYPYTYGFSTGGPVGFFHTHDESTYGDLKLKIGDMLLKEDNTNGNSYFIVSNNGLENEGGSIYISNTNGFIFEDTVGKLRDAITKQIILDPQTGEDLRVIGHPDQYPLTTLKQYIDYNRSYPNADGNLLSAKPLFYDDQVSMINGQIASTTQIQLFFSKAYATHFFHKWESYKAQQNPPNSSLPSQNALDGRLKIVIKDPVEDILIENPPYLDYDENDTEHTHIPQTEEVWNPEENPQVPFAISHYFNLMEAPNCMGEVTITKPASEYVTIFPKHLKPNKLYTAIVNNLFDVNHNGDFDNATTIDEIREVHKFVFKTSRYKDFKEQVESYFMKRDFDGNLVQREAIFNFAKPFTSDEIEASYTTIWNWNNPDNLQLMTGFTPEVVNTLTNDYQHPFDRVFEGILGLKPWDEAVCTEVTIIKDENTNTVVALIVRNPEPFNNPKFRQEVVKDTIEIMTDGNVNGSYMALFSKDHSQAIIMNSAKNISENISLKFQYKVYRDMQPGNDAIINYPVMTEVVLPIDLLNNN